MKRQQQKLAVHRDTVRQLVAADLVPVRGGWSGADCTGAVPAAPPQPVAAPKQ